MDNKEFNDFKIEVLIQLAVINSKIDGDTLKIYDPYLYTNKFNTSTKRGKVTVGGNTVYCSIDNFRNYANYKQFFCYGYNPTTVETENKTTAVTTQAIISNITNTNYQTRITASSLRIRNGASSSYNPVHSNKLWCHSRTIAQFSDGIFIPKYNRKRNYVWLKIADIS